MGLQFSYLVQLIMQYDSAAYFQLNSTGTKIMYGGKWLQWWKKCMFLVQILVMLPFLFP